MPRESGYTKDVPDSPYLEIGDLGNAPSLVFDCFMPYCRCYFDLPCFDVPLVCDASPHTPAPCKNEYVAGKNDGQPPVESEVSGVM